MKPLPGLGSLNVGCLWLKCAATAQSLNMEQRCFAPKGESILAHKLSDVDEIEVVTGRLNCTFWCLFSMLKPSPRIIDKPDIRVFIQITRHTGMICESIHQAPPSSGICLRQQKSLNINHLIFLLSSPPATINQSISISSSIKTLTPLMLVVDN
jgi:hypothetical protein